MPCPLCDASNSVPHHDDGCRRYLRCLACGLIHVPPGQRMAALAEKSRYTLHRNHPDDPAYRRFLARLAEPVLAEVPAGATGLDFGCGPGPALAQMFHEQGRPMVVYDPFFAPDQDVWLQQYDFITATEVFEHLYHPAEELNRLHRALRSGGLLGIMTSFVPSDRDFAMWHYIRDPTHVCFYDRRVFEYIAARWGFSVRFPMENVALLRRNN